ncbi:MAG: hybrid sensor histidine kinase/response regulator [Cyanobacteria bacterium P01_G01_bin.38]
MTSDPAIPQQVPAYFLQEASELLQQIDHELQTLRQDFSVSKMHSLMRTAHTLKGAAASVGLDAIKTTTHSLEDAFKALCAPGATLTPAVEGLIFEAYDCLQLLLSAQLTDAHIDQSGILDRMAGIVTRLQENLGDQFGQDGYLPTSAELGFDMTQSIFEMGVAQRLNDLEEALKTPEPDTLKALLQSQADAFSGLAESLHLPGFGEIAQVTLEALDKQPEQVVQIAIAALADYRAGQVSVLQGDRTQGGAPSPALKKFSAPSSKKSTPKNIPSSLKKPGKSAKTKVRKPHKKSKSGWFRRLWQRLNQPIHSAPTATSKPRPQQALTSTGLIDPVNGPAAAEPTPESIWEAAAALALPEVAAAHLPPADQLPAQPTAQPPSQAVSSQPTDKLPQPKPPPAAPLNSSALPREATLRVSIHHLEHLNHTIGELLTQQNRQALYNESVTAAMRTLLTRLAQQQQQLNKLQHQTLKTSAAIPLTALPSTDQPFDSLELDHYSEQQLLVQASLETMVQQMESAEAVELFVRQSSQTLEKQTRLVGDLRETLLEIRMQPIGNLLQRFHQVLNRLSEQHAKPVVLNIHGSDVLVDKAIVDKLYDPLLHLVRNAFDHGIETPEIRQQQGKPDKGEIQLSARQEGRYLVIQIQDNGQGLNLEAIRQKAIDNLLLTSEEAQQLTPAQISELIFEPDLSTVSQVNELSGRGVGLDAVRTQIKTLGGTVTVTHQPQQGTCFTLKMPANLSIAKLLLCQTDEKLYALMTDTIEQILMPRPEQVNIQNDKKVLSLRIEEKEALIPIISLSTALTYHASLPKPHGQTTHQPSEQTCPIVVMRYQKRLVGLEVDQLIGEQELVIRSLGNLSATPTYVYGCSILPDGRLGLVIDGTALVLKILQELSGYADKTAHDQDVPVSPDPSQSQTVIKQSILAKQSILIVDDSITVRNTLGETLQKAGYWVIQAKDGAEALQKLQQADVAAILCDLEMPGMNGFEFLKARQQTPEIAAIPTIMLTSRTSAKHRQLAQALGATNYLTKPYLPPKLLATLTNALGQSL